MGMSDMDEPRIVWIVERMPDGHVVGVFVDETTARLAVALDAGTWDIDFSDEDGPYEVTAVAYADDAAVSYDLRGKPLLTEEDLEDEPRPGEPRI